MGISTTTINARHIKINNSMNVIEAFEEVAKAIDNIQEDIVEQILLGTNSEKVKSVYEMTYEEYMELPGNVRL